jgi:hypothetical protein
MSAMMGLIYLADTFNVLATFTRSAEPTTVETVPDSFVGDGLLVHVREPAPGPPPDTTVFAVLAANLKFTELALDPLVLSQPREYYLDTSSTPPKPTLYTNGALTIAGPPASTFTVAASNALTSASKFAVLARSVADGTTQYISQQPATGGTTRVNLSTLAAGNYHVLVCVAGYALEQINITVP